LQVAYGAKRAYSVADWQRDFYKAFAAGVPLTAMDTKARGALLAADNQEPEPSETPDQCPAVGGGA
jgi:hypothetical protein